MRVKFHICCLLTVAAVLLSVAACEKEPVVEPEWKIDPDIYRKVVVFYAAGHNNLAKDILEDIKDLARGSFDIIDYNKDALVIFSHIGYAGSEVAPAIIKVRNRNGQMVLDTLTTLPSSTISASAETLEKALSLINGMMPAWEYDLIFSSHATGYLPAGYYSSPIKYEKGFSGKALSANYGMGKTARKQMPVPYVEPEYKPGVPRTKSIGQDVHGNLAYEMGLVNFAKAFPVRFHSIIFDCCLMGGVETAYELKDVCDYLVFSPTEIISLGMDYESMGRRLFSEDTDLTGLAEDYFKMYDRMSGDWRSATISVIDCRKLEKLAGVCRPMFEKYADSLQSMKAYRSVQRYYTDNYHWFYDLRDILAKSYATSEDLATLDSALEECIVYKAATPYFIGIGIDTYSGLSMYLPAHKGTYGNAYLNEYYKGLAWNKATGLVK